MFPSHDPQGGNRVNTINAAFDQITLDGKWDERNSLAITNSSAGNLGNGNHVGLKLINQTVTDANANGMQIGATVEDGVITKVYISNYGSNYTNGDVLRIAGAPDSRLTLTITDLTVWIGYQYTMEVDFPTIYPVKSAGQNSIRS